MQRTGATAAGRHIVGSGGGGLGSFDIEPHDGVEPGILLIDTGQLVIEQLPAGDRPIAKRPDELGGGGECGIHDRIVGRKHPPTLGPGFA